MSKHLLSNELNRADRHSRRDRHHEYISVREHKLMQIKGYGRDRLQHGFLL